MAADEFEIEGPQSANALVAATAAQIANEPWADGYALVFAIADGKLHPVPIVPAGGAIVSVSGVAPISVSPGIAPIVSLTGTVGEANGGFGASALTFGTGLLKRTGAATYTTVTDTLTVTAGTGLSGGGSVALGSSVSLSLPTLGSATTYAYPSSLTTDAQGRLTSVTAGSAPIASISVSSPITSTGGATPTLGLDETVAYNWSGVHSWSTYSIQQSISAPSAPSTGFIRTYSTTFHGVDLPSYISSLGVEISPSRDLVVIVKNTTGSSIAANKVVYVNGASGNVPTIALAQADYTMSKLPALGLTLATIADNAFGIVMTRGVISSINTNSFTVGDTLYVDAATPGAYTNIAPSRPSVEQVIGTVTVKGVGNGELMIALVPINLHRIDGTNQTSFGIGDGHTTGPMSLQMLQTAGTGVLQWTVSTARTLTLPDATDTLVGLDTSDVLTNKSISGSTNTLSNIGNSSLTNSSITITASTGLSGGGIVSLGGSTSLSVSYGTTSGTATQGNDTRLAPAPSGAGKMLYDTGTAYSALTAGSTNQVLVGGSVPSFGNVPAAAITTLTGTVSGTVTLSGAVTLNSATLGGNLAAGSNKVTGLAAGSAAGDSLRFEQGGGVPVCFYLNTAQGWTANNYLGIGGDGSSSVNVNIVPFPVPQAGTIKNLRVQGLTNTGTNTTITIYKASSAVSPTYSATALTCLVSSGTATGNDTTHSVSVNAGDLLVAFSNATWSVNGCAVSFIYLPS